VLHAQAAPGRYAVIIVLDGDRPDSFNLAPMPHLRALMAHGVTFSQAFAGQLPAITPASHATIGTGLLPEHHGVQGFLWEDARTHLVDNPTQTISIQNGALEQVMAANHVQSLARQVKLRYPSGRIASVAGHKCYASDAMGTASADYILCALLYHDRWVAQAVGRHRPPAGAINNPSWDVPIPPRTSGFGPAVQQWRVGTENAWTTRYALWAFHRIRYPRVLMINLAETDVLGHFAPNQAVIAGLMRQFDGLLGQIESAYRRAGILSRTDFVITADHGMTPIHSFVPYSTLSQAVSAAGTTPVYIEHDTGVALGLKDDRKSRAVALNIFRLGGTKVDAAYYKVLQAGRWRYRAAAWQPEITASLRAAYLRLVNTEASPTSADVFAVLAPHVSSRNFAIYGYAWRAGHLGPQWGDQHIPLVLAGPGVEQGETLSYPARLVDIAPTVERLLGAPLGRTDGVVLGNALTDPSPAELARQQARGKTLRPVVSALERRMAQ
jgi:predicted AlkP superfamily pyrophosphatase or phosphodiesterase